jgi:upstream activation factor subunit UAF30
MPKKTTSAKTEKVVIISNPVVETVATSAVEKKARKPKAVKTVSSDVSADVSSDVSPDVIVSISAPIVEQLTMVSHEVPLAEQSIEFLAKLQQLGVLISSLKAEYRTLEKKWSREIKVAQKQSSKRKRKAGNRAPSGFVKPTKISDELASFLGKENGTEMARTDVTREINTYIRAHKLQDKDNGRKINPDTKLATLLKLKKTDELTYFNLQKYMSPHFAKAIKLEVSAPVSVPELAFTV